MKLKDADIEVMKIVSDKEIFFDHFYLILANMNKIIENSRYANIVPTFSNNSGLAYFGNSIVSLKTLIELWREDKLIEMRKGIQGKIFVYLASASPLTDGNHIEGYNPYTDEYFYGASIHGALHARDLYERSKENKVIKVDTTIEQMLMELNDNKPLYQGNDYAVLNIKPEKIEHGFKIEGSDEVLTLGDFMKV